MPGSLGLYIEDNLIKYAKVSKNNDIVKIESFGVKFYEKIDEAIQQIIDETYSYKIPISTNLIEEKYNYFEVFEGLKKKDIEGIVKTSFENYCYDNSLNKDSYEQRMIFTNSSSSRDKIRAIHISSPNTSIAKRKNQLAKYKTTSISPIGITISNLVKQNKQENSIIVNMEENTIVTQLGNHSIKEIRVLPHGSKEIFDKINAKENSYSKAYEVCKNTTIYTDDAKDLQIQENEYLEDIMPTLYNIVTEIRNFINETIDTVDKIYLTGTLSVINNIDIYFQEYLQNIKCEILKPYFVSNNSKINIKDYIEANSAIALALQGIEHNNIKSVNFLKETATKKIIATMNTNVSLRKLNEIDFSELYNNNKNLIDTLTSTGILFFVFYIVMTLFITGMLNRKDVEVENAIQYTNNQIQELEKYNTQINNRIGKYKSIISSIESNNDKASENKRYKDVIPNLMNNLMAIIPKEVQLVSLSNTNDTHIVIEAKSNKYEQLAFFKTKLKTEEVLKNIISDTGVSSGSTIKITIEGELP